MARAKKAAAKGNGKGKAPKGGVHHEGGGPVYEEPLSEQQRALRSEQLVNLMANLDQLDADYIAERTEYRSARKELNKEIHELAESLRLGVVKRPAQASLPGTVADEANA